MADAESRRHRPDDRPRADAKSYRRHALSTRSRTRHVLSLSIANCNATLLCASFFFHLDLQFASREAVTHQMASSTSGSKTNGNKDTISNKGKSGKRTLSDVLIGPARDVRDPEVFHSQSLAVFLAMLMALTVFIISASYSQTIDLFPTGGGAYLVATKLLGKYFGLVSGSALVVDYVLTIAISIASGADAIFSFMPISWHPFKFYLCLAVVLLMVLMNLRGVKESVLSLLPIFIAFIVMHVWLVGYAILSRAPELPSIVGDAVKEVHASSHSIGMLALAIIFLRAYSLGGGTYTGIEAVSNGLPILREPRAETGKRTMIYMAISLAFVAGGILLG